MLATKPLPYIVRPFIAITVLVLCSYSFGRAQNVRELIREADVQMQKGNAELAIANYLQAKDQVPENNLLIFKLGKAYLQSSFKYKALPYLLTAYKEIPESDPDMELYLAQAFQYNYQFEEVTGYY